MNEERYKELEELALDLIWSWNRSADEIWRMLDELLFEQTRNPWVVLQTVSRDKLKRLLEDAHFTQSVRALLETYVRSPSDTWFHKQYGDQLGTVAYFSMEFMLSEALPIYSGGLGNVAGDQLKAASDLGVPVIGIGLLYQQGYFRQIVDAQGNQQALYPFNSPTQLPIQPLRRADGEWFRVELALPGYSLWLRTWEAKVGRARLYLLDSNDVANYPVHRGITSELYGGDLELRLKQELILGIGGVRLLEQLGIKPEVCHLNEGHAAFAILERARLCMQKEGISFKEALATIRSSLLFTTHTAVPAGFDRFPYALIATYLTRYAENQLHIPFAELWELGQEGEWFNMAHLAIRGSGAINAVSRLHGHVSQRLFAPVFPRFPVDEVPIGFVTNGIHTPSWISPAADELWSQSIDVSHACNESKAIDPKLCHASEAQIWAMRNNARKALVLYGRKRLSFILAARGMDPEVVAKAKSLFHPEVLTLGFARRFATYKRPNMLLSDPERLVRLLTNPLRPVQLVIAGKAHPADEPGKAMIREWIEFIERPEMRSCAIFLTDYDMLMAEKLVQGVDVWINTPRRPWEACGTSGMKVLVNGGLNLSELDGWWAEAYSPDVGWALGDGLEHGDDLEWDAKEAARLYDLLEQQVIPEFYQRGTAGIPEAWVKRIRASMLQLTPAFCAHRAVRSYTEQYYLPAAEKSRRRLKNHCALGKELARCQRLWQKLSSASPFRKVESEVVEDQYRFRVQVDLGELSSQNVRLEMYAVATPPICQAMHQTAHTGSLYTYEALVSKSRPEADYCPRIVPNFPEANVFLEFPYIVWQR